MEAVYLCRVSSKEQEAEGYSLSSQEKLLIEYGEKRNLKKNKVFSFAESASQKKQRKIFDEMMRYIKKKNIKVIVCEKADRFTRNLKDLLGMYNWLEDDEERQLHLVKDGLVLHKNSKSQEKLNLDLKVVIAKNYIDNLTEEVKKGQKEKLEQGWSPGNPPIGYKSVLVEGRIIHVKDDKYALWVTRMLNLYATGSYSVKKLTDLLYEEGLRSRSGYKVVVARIYSYLKNPYYCGKIMWNGHLYNGKQEPLIDVVTYEKIQRLLKRKTIPKYNIHDYLFKGMIHCAECGGLITWEKQKTFIYGHCNHYRDCKQTVWVKEPEIEEQLVHALSVLQINNERIRRWIYKAIIESHEYQTQNDYKLLADLQLHLADVKKKLDRLTDMRADGEIDKETYLHKYNETKNNIDDLNLSISRVNKHEDNLVKLGVKFFEISQNAKAEYEKKSPDVKRKLLKLIYEQISLNKGKISFTYTRPFELLSRAVSLTNRSKAFGLLNLRNNIFEQKENIDLKTQSKALLEDYSVVRRGRDSNSR